MMHPSKIAPTALTLAVLSACAVGPNFKPPPAPSTPGYVPPGSLPAATASAPLPGGDAQHFVDGLDIPGQWWELFKSAELNALIERGLANSPTLEAAQAALRQANENVAVQRGSLYPSVSGTYQGERQKSSGAQFGLPSAGSFLYSLNSATVNVSYTLDAFGGIRRQVEALQAQADYQQFALEASYLSLTANIVTAAVTEASLRAQIAATEDIARAQQVQLDIIQRRLTAGGAARSDVLQQQATLQSTLANLPALRSQLAQERNQLAVYVGALPADYNGGQINLDSLTLPAELPISLPSKLVEQRPDVRQYSALLHQATAQIGVATANMLPQLTLTGSYGGVATRFSDVFSPSSAVWSLIGGVTQPIFKGGQLVHQRRADVAAAQEAAANYKSTVITAFQNVSNTLYALQADADALAAETVAEQSAAESLRLVQAQFKSGGASYLQVLTAEQTYQNAAVALVKARAQRYADTAALFQALGGGWWNRTDVAVSNSSDCCKGPL
ncbi:MAG: transporter [Gammaproteobacteria bacterium]|nr:transporter [Gammaproteobacteria bacterium]